MGIRFSENGPEFPTELLDELLNGSVIFLCGAGVSAPQLPSFADLVTKTYEKIRTKPSLAEASSIKDGRYEEALGTLSRRLSDQSQVHETVRGLLKIDNPDLSNHTTLLRLSRSLDNRLALITTNFDTLFELALASMELPDFVSKNSYAGQSLPLPGASDFQGIIHIHGRNADLALGLPATPLVLTSAEYGDAYMRAGWAARFLFDLVRCRTLILVGYSASDAPIRYFLNILEADRARFSDLKPVYALDSFELEIRQTKDRWDSLAVRPLAYKKGTSKKEAHDSLWNDLAQLAEFMERPSQWRKKSVQQIFSAPTGERSPSEVDKIRWIFSGKQDIWDVVVKEVQDPKWFDFLRSENLLSGDTAAHVLAAWCSQNWDDQRRIDIAVAWHKIGGEKFGMQLEFRLRSMKDERPIIKKIWSLIRRACQKPVDDRFARHYLAQRVIKRDTRLDEDLVAAVDFISPGIDLRQRRTLASNELPSVDSQTISDFVGIRLSTDDRINCQEILDALLKTDAEDRILQLATGALHTVVETAMDAGLISATYDSIDRSVPSVEAHGQNEFHDGAVYLAQLLTGIFPKIAQQSLISAKTRAEEWSRMRSQLGTRLWLSAMRSTNIYSSTEAIDLICKMPKSRFWSIKKELILAISDHAVGADEAVIRTLCQRIVEEGPSIYTEIELGDPNARDWRPYARAHNIWLRLQAIRRSRPLPEDYSEQLEQIEQKFKIGKKDFSEEDLFDTYSSGVRSLIGNASLIGNVPPERRLAEAKELAVNWDPEVQRSWSAYCSADPQGALSALREGGLDVNDAVLWTDLISTLAWPNNNDPSAIQKKLVSQEIFIALEAAPEGLIQLIANSLTDLWPVLIGSNLDALSWWDQLWNCIERVNEDLDLTADGNFLDRVINHPAGRLSEHLIAWIDSHKKPKRRIGAEEKRLLEILMRSETKAGALARGRLVQDAGFINYISSEMTRDFLRPWLLKLDVEGKQLRSVLLEYSNLGPSATKTFRNAILIGARESEAADETAAHVAARIMNPLFQEGKNNTRTVGGLSAITVQDTLKTVAPSILDGAAHVLRIWMQKSGDNPHEFWLQKVKPIFKSIWPPEREFRSARRSIELANMCVCAEIEFPDAFETVRHFLVPFIDDHNSMYFLENSKVPEQFPEKILELIWILCGPGSTGQSFELGKILDRIILARPGLNIDRRIQWLEQGAIRY